MIQISKPIRVGKFFKEGENLILGTNDWSLLFYNISALIDSFKTSIKAEPVLIKDLQDHHFGSIYCLDISKDDELIATGGLDNMIKVIVNPLKMDEDTDEVLTIKFEGHKGKVWSVAFVSNLQIVSCGDKENVIHVWDSDKAEFTHDLEGHEGGAV